MKSDTFLSLFKIYLQWILMLNYHDHILDATADAFIPPWPIPNFAGAILSFLQLEMSHFLSLFS